MDSYATLAMNWLAEHPNPSELTSDPESWATQVSDQIATRIRQLVDQLAPTIPGEGFHNRRSRLITAQTTATEMALDELLPTHTPVDDLTTTDWTPLQPDLSDLL